MTGGRSMAGGRSLTGGVVGRLHGGRRHRRRRRPGGARSRRQRARARRARARRCRARRHRFRRCFRSGRGQRAATRLCPRPRSQGELSTARPPRYRIPLITFLPPATNWSGCPLDNQYRPPSYPRGLTSNRGGTIAETRARSRAILDEEDERQARTRSMRRDGEAPRRNEQAGASLTGANRQNLCPLQPREPGASSRSRLVWLRCVAVELRITPCPKCEGTSA